MAPTPAKEKVARAVTVEQGEPAPDRTFSRCSPGFTWNDAWVDAAGGGKGENCWVTSRPSSVAWNEPHAPPAMETWAVTLPLGSLKPPLVGLTMVMVPVPQPARTTAATASVPRVALSSARAFIDEGSTGSPGVSSRPMEEKGNTRPQRPDARDRMPFHARAIVQADPGRR